MPSPVERIAKKFVTCFSGVELFEIGIRLAEENSPDGKESMRIQTVSRDKVTSPAFLRFLQAMNAQNRHIYIRPQSPHKFTLIDDAQPFRVGWAEDEGFQPSAVIETSPDNFQLWLNHGQVLSNPISTQASKILANIFDGDPSSADFRHFGRFPGFTNPKPKYLVDGVKPFSKLVTAREVVYDKAALVIAEATDKHRQKEQVQRELKKTFELSAPTGVLRKSWQDFYQDSRYAGDLNRVDMSYAIYALGQGLPEDQLRADLSVRDLTHKGSKSRQIEYIERTIKKAYSILRS